MKFNWPAIRLTIALLGLGLFASAQTSIYLGAFSWHPGRPDLNGDNRLFAVEHDHWVAGRFSNSYSRTTTLAGYQFQWNIGKHWKAGLLTGVDYGYRDCINGQSSDTYNRKARFCPLIAPTIGYKKWDIEPILFLLPDAIGITFKASIYD